MHLTEGRKKGRKEGSARRHSVAMLLALCAGLTGSNEMAAQAPLAGAWNQQFDHEDGITSTISATDPRTAFTSTSYTVTWLPPRGAFPARMNAAHAALIPKGPHQGKILVWDVLPIIGTPPSGRTSPTNLYSYQAYSIVDPSPTIAQGQVRFRNFLLPIRPVVLDAGGNPIATGLFCTGHAWSQHGDLVVVGGTSFTETGGPEPAQSAANMTWVFAPSEQSIDYPGEFGRWFEGPALHSSRYYPTAILTGPIARLQGNHAILVLGGELVVDEQPDATWNSYEALEVRFPPGTNQQFPSGLVKDTFTIPPNPPGEWAGPMLGSNYFQDSLSYYPRTHLLTNGQVFLSGFAPLSSRVDHQTTAWSLTAGQAPVPGGWNLFRQYGSSVRFPNLGPFQDWIVRIGGKDSAGGTTPTTDAIDAGNPFGQWSQTFSLNLARSRLNCVVLPDASILAVGGVSQTDTPHFMPEIYSPGSTGWTLLQPGFSARDYHATALTLPNGRVFVAGGEHRSMDRNGGQAGVDYEVFTPPYLAPANNAMPILATFYGLNTSYNHTEKYYALARSAKYIANIGTLPLGTTIHSVVLMAPGSTTHHSDMSQRYHQVPFRQKTATAIEFDTPPPGSSLPAGIFMLNLVTNAGVPTEASWVKLP